MNTTSGNGGFTPMIHSAVYATTKAARHLPHRVPLGPAARARRQDHRATSSIRRRARRECSRPASGNPAATATRATTVPGAPPADSGRDQLTPMLERAKAAGQELAWAPLSEVADLCFEGIRDGVFWMSNSTGDEPTPGSAASSVVRGAVAGRSHSARLPDPGHQRDDRPQGRRPGLKERIVTRLAGDRYIVISSDGHAGAQMHEYRDYLESKYHDEFDAWANDVREPVRRPARPTSPTATGTARRACASSRTTASSPRCCSPTRSRRSSRRRTCSRAPPEPDDEYELRWAGLKAHNRWLADFCADTPGRRAGMAQIFLNDVDAAVAEIEWARRARPLRRRPAARRAARLRASAALRARRTSRSGRRARTSTCRSTTTAAAAGPDFGSYAGIGMAVFMVELGWFSHRVFWHMVFGGVFAPLPAHQAGPHRAVGGLGPGASSRCSTTSTAASSDPDTAESHFGGELIEDRHRASPSDYWRTQLLRRRKLLPAVRDAAAPRDRRRQDHVGPGLPAHRGHLPVHHRGAAQHASPASTPTRWRAMVGGNAAGVYGFDLDALAPVAERVGPTVDEVAAPLDEIPADSRSIAFAGESVKPW